MSLTINIYKFYVNIKSESIQIRLKRHKIILYVDVLQNVKNIKLYFLATCHI